MEHSDLDLDELIILIDDFLQKILSDLGIHSQWINYTKVIVLLISCSIIIYALQYLVRKILITLFKRAGKVTKSPLFKYAIKNRLPHYLALIVPYSFVISVIPIVFVNFKSMIKICTKLTDIYMVFMVIWTIMAVIKSLASLLWQKPAFHGKPMKSYLQVIQIILYIIGLIILFSVLTGKSVTAFFAAMGAASAILLLMFKDTIMGFVSSIQISTNNMVQIGDWITMSKYGADGTVEEINLTTVKVRNFDKTITSIPTYALTTDSFQNWRGMQESGGRRIKRSLFVKHSDIRFLNDDELDKYKNVSGLEEYIKQKRDEYDDRNKNIDQSVLVNGHRLTNCDLYIQYCSNYLKNHPLINTNMTLLVRLLPSTDTGLPIEIYTFTSTTVWADYEAIQSEIINHLISAIQHFDLEIFESGSGSDDYNVYLKSTDNQ